MGRRNVLVFLILLVIFFLALAVVLPLDEGALGRKGIRLGLDLQGGLHLEYQADLTGVPPSDRGAALDGVIAVLENRINPMGVTEPLIQKKGGERVLVELPGKSIPEREKEGLARVDILEFGELVLASEEAKWQNELGGWKPATAVVAGETKALTSRYFRQNTYVAQGQFGEILLVFEWNEEGRQLSEAITSRLIGQPLGIFEGSHSLRSTSGRPIAPTVSSIITDRGQIERLSLADATLLSKQLNYGRLPVPLSLIREETVTPILRSDFVGRAARAGVIGTALVMLFMTLYYRLAGLVASFALLFYGVFVLALFKLWPGGGVTLTLSGIAGFVVSIGMAVDANILIFERLKEELNTGQSLGAAIEAGFSRAFRAIWDSNVTTFIVCAILYWLGSHVTESAPVKGFALTLFIGVAVSMLTAIFVSRTLLRLFVGTPFSRRVSLFTSVYTVKV